MSDPYNSAESFIPSPGPVRSNASVTDNIARLDVSEKWKDRFRAIRKAGGWKLPAFRDLPASERRGLNFNFLAFLFGPFYFIAKGLWRQAIVYLVLAVLCVLIMDALGFDRFSRAVGYGFAALYAVRANVSYYRKVVEGEAPWI
jgi:uncharacterized protein DUF2628